MYQDDNDGKLVLNPDGGSSDTNAAWVAGNMTNPAQRTDPILLRNALLGPYAQNVDIYKCPGDKSDNIRSVSMNSRMGGNVNANPSFLLFNTYGSITKPAEFFVFIDERNDTINDGYFRVDMNDNYANLVIADFPASYHAKSGSLSFADGHSEIHRWRDGRTTPPSTSNMQPSPKNQDFIWLEQHTSEHANGSPWP